MGRRSTMASEEGNVAAVEELQQEQLRGREEQARTQSRRSKSKGPVGESLGPQVASLESHMEGVRASVGELSDQIENLILENGEISRVAKAMIEELGCTFRGELRPLTQDFSDLRKFVEGELHNLHAKMDEIFHEWQSYRFTSSPASTSTTTVVMQGLKVPKPAIYNGTRNATIVKNFLFGLEQYFEAMGVVDDLARISNALTFFRDAAQLWWQRKHAERERGICVINTWEQFKAELRKHFVPHNANTKARGKLRRFRQSGSISDYIKEFTTIMLEIEDKDALFYFKDGLKD
ncbi:hypothetical protein L6164_013371 [Bauhinia variegata]|uniref:Uncharacterized protein n=1 Tax=Bauhinia variegata TaxID=167791 RepID=A0ACB9NF57_BAUVA|nr:hypothetical protein L6164_013371 [Bauhinia variegata]